ncbi:MAG: DUF6909 family protein [Desulfatibacillaceae bacterium]
MQDLTKAQKARIAIRVFKTTADAVALRGFFRLTGRSGQQLEEALRVLSPEIYGTMNDPRIIELKGLEYVMDRLPRGIEACSRIVLTAQEELAGTSFEMIVPPKRRRTSYRVNEKEMCFILTRGLSEVYDILTHLTFMYNEAKKIRNQIRDVDGQPPAEWRKLEQDVARKDELSGRELDQAIWNLSRVVGGTYQDTKATWEYMEKSRREKNANTGLFEIIHQLGLLADTNRENGICVHFSPALRDMIGHHKYGEKWARSLKARLAELGYLGRPLHVVSANMHSVMNLLYGYGAIYGDDGAKPPDDFYEIFHQIRDNQERVVAYARTNGLVEFHDDSGMYIDCQIIDGARLCDMTLHPGLRVDADLCRAERPVILVMDYAFGAQAFEVMDELLEPIGDENGGQRMPVASVSVMGKAGTLCGNKGDIMLATSHVFEGEPHNYTFTNQLSRTDFDDDVTVWEGPILTVLGTSLQNTDVLEKFQRTSWKAVGLEMEGGHYQMALSAAMVRGWISRDVNLCYAYYASDNPLVSGQTLSSGSMGKEGIRPTYMITRAILEKILNGFPNPEQ